MQGAGCNILYIFLKLVAKTTKNRTFFLLSKRNLCAWHLIHKCLVIGLVILYWCWMQGAGCNILYILLNWLQKLLKTEPFFYFLKEIYTGKKTSFLFIFSAVSKAWATYLWEFNSTVAESVCYHFFQNFPALQSRTGKYRVLQGNPCNENRIPTMRTGFPVMKTGFSLWELTYREFPVSLTGFGFAV